MDFNKSLKRRFFIMQRGDELELLPFTTIGMMTDMEVKGLIAIQMQN